MSWNKYMTLIEDPSHIPTKHSISGKFCPMGIINPNKYCILPCFFWDHPYCTNMGFPISIGKKEAAEKWWNECMKSELRKRYE